MRYCDAPPLHRSRICPAGSPVVGGNEHLELTSGVLLANCDTVGEKSGHTLSIMGTVLLLPEGTYLFSKATVTEPS